jgi:Protein of unknown function (DUF1566)
MHTERKTCYYAKSLPQRYVTLPLVVAISVLTGGCNEAAGLKEHKLFDGFPDSRSEVLCAPAAIVPLRISCSEKMAPSPQDGQVQLVPPEYLEEGLDVRDTITDLVWRKKAGDSDDIKDYDAAIAYCGSLGNYRLPSRLELISLLDYGGSDILIDPVFQGMQGIRYRTVTEYAPGSSEFTNTHWGVNFDGRVPPLVINSETILPGQTNQLHDSNKSGVLCVRNDSPPLVAGPFVETGVNNKFLLDKRTNLFWIKTPIKTDNWNHALTRCRDLADGSYGDFRLPNAKEIATIIDDTTPLTTDGLRTYAAFDIENNPTLWTSTPTPDARFAYALSTNGASIGREDRKIDYYHALCVRGPY